MKKSFKISQITFGHKLVLFVFLVTLSINFSSCKKENNSKEITGEKLTIDQIVLDLKEEINITKKHLTDSTNLKLAPVKKDSIVPKKLLIYNDRIDLDLKKETN